jgi:hypothetical protein
MGSGLFSSDHSKRKFEVPGFLLSGKLAVLLGLSTKET